MNTVTGIHHITAIAGNPQENLDFYIGVLGLRMVKKSINQDVPDTYHLFFADGGGHPGTDLTFFPWPQMAQGRQGASVWGEVAFSVPEGSLSFWEDRLRSAGVQAGATEKRFGEQVLPFRDPHGMALALVETGVYDRQGFDAWDESSVPEQYQIRNLSSVRLVVRDPAPTVSFLSKAYGFVDGERETLAEGEWRRYIVGEGAGGQRVDIRVDPEATNGTWGIGSVHHVAFRVDDEPAELAVREQILTAGGHPTGLVDRFWFRSVYTREPSGALVEIATDGPGFAVDEDAERLGETLVLPPWYEGQREQIESILAPLSYDPAALRERFVSRVEAGSGSE